MALFSAYSIACSQKCCCFSRTQDVTQLITHRKSNSGSQHCLHKNTSLKDWKNIKVSRHWKIICICRRSLKPYVWGSPTGVTPAHTQIPTPLFIRIMSESWVPLQGLKEQHLRKRGSPEITDDSDAHPTHLRYRKGSPELFSSHLTHTVLCSHPLSPCYLVAATHLLWVAYLLLISPLALQETWTAFRN